MTREQQIAAVRHVADSIVEAVKVAGSLGAPGGTLYAALMGAGCTLDQFNQFMGALQRAGR